MGIEIHYYSELSSMDVYDPNLKDNYLQKGSMWVTSPIQDLSNFWKKYRERKTYESKLA